jgi:hypothetical protein
MCQSAGRTAAPDAIFSCDVGTPTIWAARYLRMNGQRRLLGSFSHGSMANALPQAIGAQVSHPHRQVVTLSGDGGLSMLLGDLLTLRQLHLPVKIVVFNNSALGFVELEMKAAGILDFATNLPNPDFAQMATAAGVLGLKAESPAQVRPMLAEALQYDGAALVEVVVNRQELSMPPTIQLDQMMGFSLYVIKAGWTAMGRKSWIWPKPICSADAKQSPIQNCPDLFWPIPRNSSKIMEYPGNKRIYPSMPLGRHSPVTAFNLEQHNTLHLQLQWLF